MNRQGKNIWTGIAARIALLTVGIIWGSSLVVVKSSTDSVSPCLLVALRFTIAFIFLSAIFWKKWKLMNCEYFKSGLIIGLCLFVAYEIQTVGVTFAMPGKSAFLSSIYCVIVPFIFWVISGNRPNLRNITAAILCASGIVISSVTSGFSIASGDLLALLSGFFFAVHIAVVGKFSAGKDPIFITILQFGFCALSAWISAFLLEGNSMRWYNSSMGGVLYLAVLCTSVALLLQNVGQKYADPASASILMSTESVFGIIFSVIFMKEQLTGKLILGFTLIFASVLISVVTVPKRGA